MFGPHTLQAYISQFQYLAANLAQVKILIQRLHIFTIRSMYMENTCRPRPNINCIYIYKFKGNTVAPGEDPPNLLDDQFSLLPEIVFETTPPFTKFGDCVADAESQYTPVRSHIFTSQKLFYIQDI